MKFINKSIAKLLKFEGYTFCFFGIMLFSLGLPIIVVNSETSNLKSNILLWIIGVILLFTIGGVCGTVGELALDKLKLDDKND